MLVVRVLRVTVLACAVARALGAAFWAPGGLPLGGATLRLPGRYGSGFFGQPVAAQRGGALLCAFACVGAARELSRVPSQRAHYPPLRGAVEGELGS